MIYLKKIKKFVFKYWEALVAFILVLAGILIGTSKGRERVLSKDVDLQKKSMSEVKKGTDKSIKKYQETLEKNKEDKKSKEEEADKKEDERTEEILKDPKELDTILKTKYGLKGD